MFVDVHTHMISRAWLAMLTERGAPHYTLGQAAGQPIVRRDGAPFMTLFPEMWDYEARLRDMDAAGVDVAIVSLSGPNVWNEDADAARAAALMNDDMAAAQARWPARIRWLASIPWQNADLALAELDRACSRGAVGVMCLANVGGRSLTAEAFAPIWAEIDRRRLPVLIHPTAPPGVDGLDMARYNLVASVGFVFDTSLAIARMIHDGFLDRHTGLGLIAAHGGGVLPYLAGRLDFCHRRMPPARERISTPPTDYLRRIWYDAVVFRQDALELCLEIAGEDRVLYGSDYPHNIGDLAGCRARVEALGPTLAARIGGENACALFDLDPTPLPQS